MPKSPHHSALARQWELLRKLPSRPPGVTASELTARLAEEGYATSKRTVERDLNELSCIFPLRCNDASVPFGWYWMPGREPDIPEFDLPEALSLYLAEGVLRASLPPSTLDRLESKFRRARERLAASRATPHSQWRNKVRFVPLSLPMIPPKVRPGILREIQNALLLGRSITADYRPFGTTKSKPFTLHPLALVHRGAITHLVATAADYGDVRQYALHRFYSVKVTETPARRPKGFDIDRYIESGALEFGDPHPITLKARISDKLSRYLRETPLSKNQTITPGNEPHILRADVKDTWQLHWWILSQSPEITVIGPKYLAEEIRQSLTDALRGYQRKR